MKKFTLIFTMAIGLAFFAKGQVFVEDVNINNLDISYCKLVGYQKFLSNKVIVNIDYGQERKFLGKIQMIKDAEGESFKFNSMIDALNFMDQNGWSYVNNYAVTTGNQNVYHFLLQRDK